MSDWDDDAPRRDDRGGADVKKGLLIGAVAAGAVIAWMVFARPSDELHSTSGFDMGSTSGSPSGGRPFEARPKTSLDMVSAKIGEAPSSVAPGLLPGSQEPQAAQDKVEPAPAAAAAQAASAPAASKENPAAVAKESPEDEAKTLAGAGVPTDARGLNNLGAQPGMLSALAAKMLNHPKVLAAVFNNKKVVDAFMSRKTVQENCQNGESLKNYLSDPNSGGMKNVFPVIQQALGNSATASGLVSALAGTEMATRLTACPSLKQVGNDSSAITSIAMANPKAMGLLMDPRGMTALASNPQAAGALAGLQSKLGGLGGAK